LKDCGGGNAIDIIVADDADAGLGDDGFRQTLRALLHILQGGGLRHKTSNRWIEKGFGFVQPDAARRHDAAENFRQFVALRYCLRQAFILQARGPAPAA
jgi:hypothetical protein